MNETISLQSIIDDEFDILMTKDCNGLNAGSVIWKNSPWSHDFLRQVYDLHNATFINQIDTWWEQAAILHLLQNDADIASHIRALPARSMNAWPNTSTWPTCDNQTYQDGDFVVHFPAGFKTEIADFMAMHKIPS